MKSVALLAARAQAGVLRVHPDPRRTPTTPSASTARVAYGPLVEVFVLDMRSYRGPNSAEPPGRRWATSRPSSAAAQLALAEAPRWRRRAPPGRSSPATCRSASSVTRRARCFEAVANGDDGPAARPRARDRRPARASSRDERIRNVVWITGDVHYCAAHHYDPARARVHRLRSVLGVRRRPAARRHVRPERARHDLRARGDASSASRRA